MNRMSLIGNLTRDPQLRQVQTRNGMASVCSFGVAVNRRNSDNNEADYFNITVWNRMGEACAKYLAKGSKVFVSGPISQRTYQARDGSTRAAMEIMAADVEFLTRSNETGEAAQAAPATAADLQPMGNLEDELPF